MASSSSLTDSQDNYDVFLSFRGEDTRYNFTSHLYDALCRNNVKAFIDYKIKRGDEITPALERVIEGARISIIVFSSNYALSPFCLDELVKIMECRESKAQIILPIFYKVEPSEETYQEAFRRHQTNIKGNKKHRGEAIKPRMKKVQRWKSAYCEALELAGWHVLKNSDETEFIGKVTKEVSEKLNSGQRKGEELISISIVGQTAEDNFRTIWECLMNDKTSRVGIYGMGGVGKTTIATRINNMLLKDDNSFTHIYWVTASKDSTTFKLQNGIAKAMSLDFFGEDDEKKRAVKLWKELQSKKFVLILDDVWEAFEIEDVGIPLLVGGGKLLLTTRSYGVCRIMECKTIKMKPLLEEEALDLFLKESRHQMNNCREWIETVYSIVEECAGLPLAIVVVARIVRGVVEIREWKNTLRELKKPCEGENYVMEEKVFRPLKFSYDRLPSDKHRQCFLYCSLFPEDYEFKRNDLITYWVSEGLIDELDSREEEFDKCNHMIDELIFASLLERKDEDCIKMHDVIRDMARTINLNVGLRFQDPSKEAEWSFTIGCVEVMDKMMLKSFPNARPRCSKLRALFLRDDRIMNFPGSFFASTQSLTVLNMHGVEYIPNSINTLGNLRLLILYKSWYLNYIPSLAGLGNLRHLKISLHDKLLELPQGMERLVNLRVLDISQNRSLSGSFSSGVLEKLSHLQILDLRGSRVEVEPKALINLEKLETLRVHFNDLHKLHFYVKSRHWRRLVDYQFFYGEGVGNWRKAMSLDEIKDVQEWKGECGFIPDDIQLLQLLNWESPMFDVLRSRIFTNLQMIRIWKYKGKYIFTPHLATQILQRSDIKELFIIQCNVEEIITTEEEEEEEWVNQSSYNNYTTVVLTELKALTLRGLFCLTSIYRGRMMCPTLEFVDVFECDKLQRLPFCKGNQQNQIIQLEGDISKGRWDSLQWDNSDDRSIYHTKWKGQISGTSFPDDIQHMNLDCWEIHMFDVLRNRTFSNLQTLHISRYNGRYIFTHALAQQLLYSIKHIWIFSQKKRCLEEIIAKEEEEEEEGVNQTNYNNYPPIELPNLKILRLDLLEELRSIYRGNMVCPSLKFIQLKKCYQLERLPFSIGNQQNPIIELEGITRWCWDSLCWDDSNAKSMYHPQFSEM